MAIGLSLAVIIAIPLGLMMGRSNKVAAFFNPLLMVTYPVPKAALMPIIMLWLGVGDIAKMLVIFLGVSLPVIYHSFQGARAVEEKMLWSGAAMGLSSVQRMLRIVLPAALPEILTGCRTGLVLALITMVTSEMTRYRGVAYPIIPRQRKRVLRKFIAVGDVQRGGQRRFLADLIWSNYLSDFYHLGVIRLQIGERDRAVRCTKIDAKTETCAHVLKVSVCIVV